MESTIYVPNSLCDAGRQIRLALAAGPLESLPKSRFICTWCSLAYLYPGLHPDGFDDYDSGWPRVLRRFAAEAWRRAESGELADDELYPTEAAWSRIFDEMLDHDPDETMRRASLASAYGRSADD